MMTLGGCQAAGVGAGEQGLLTQRMMRDVAAARAGGGGGGDGADAGAASLSRDTELSYEVYVRPGDGGGGDGSGLGGLEARVWALERAVGVRGAGGGADDASGAGVDAVLAGRTLSQAVADVRWQCSAVYVCVCVIVYVL